MCVNLQALVKTPGNARSLSNFLKKKKITSFVFTAHFAHFLSFAHCLVLHIANKTDLPGWQPTQSHPRVWFIGAYLLKRSKLTHQMSEYWSL